MSVRPLPVRAGHRRPGQRLVTAAAARIRQVPTTRGLARRRLVINLAKWLLPATALVLLATIALWPEIERMRDTARDAYQRAASQIGAATLTDAHYRHRARCNAAELAITPTLDTILQPLLDRRR